MNYVRDVWGFTLYISNDIAAFILRSGMYASNYPLIQ